MSVSDTMTLMKLNLRQKVLLGVGVLFIIFCLWYFLWPNRPVANLNGHLITTGTISARQDVLRAYADPKAPRPSKKDAFREIVKEEEQRYAYTALGGTPPTHEELVEAANVINRESLAPSILKNIQDRLGGPTSDQYLTQFIAPAVEQQHLQALLVKKGIEERQAVVAELPTLLASGEFKTSAKLRVIEIDVSKKKSSTATSSPAAAFHTMLAKMGVLNVTAEKNLGIVESAGAAIVIVSPTSTDMLHVTMYVPEVRGPMQYFYDAMKVMPRTIYDPYYLF